MVAGSSGSSVLWPAQNSGNTAKSGPARTLTGSAGGAANSDRSGGYLKLLTVCISCVYRSGLSFCPTLPIFLDNTRMRSRFLLFAYKAIRGSRDRATNLSLRLRLVFKITVGRFQPHVTRIPPPRSITSSLSTVKAVIGVAPVTFVGGQRQTIKLPERRLRIA